MSREFHSCSACSLAISSEKWRKKPLSAHTLGRMPKICTTGCESMSQLGLDAIVLLFCLERDFSPTFREPWRRLRKISPAERVRSTQKTKDCMSVCMGACMDAKGIYSRQKSKRWWPPLWCLNNKNILEFLTLYVTWDKSFVTKEEKKKEKNTRKERKWKGEKKEKQHCAIILDGGGTRLSWHLIAAY